VAVRMVSVGWPGRNPEDEPSDCVVRHVAQRMKGGCSGLPEHRQQCDT
jgi:hypothetical protein